MLIGGLCLSVFFNLLVVSRSCAELSIPISTLLQLLSHTHLPRLVNLTLSLFKKFVSIDFSVFVLIISVP